MRQFDDRWFHIVEGVSWVNAPAARVLRIVRFLAVNLRLLVIMSPGSVVIRILMSMSVSMSVGRWRNIFLKMLVIDMLIQVYRHHSWSGLFFLFFVFLCSTALCPFSLKSAIVLPVPIPKVQQTC